MDEIRGRGRQAAPAPVPELVAATAGVAVAAPEAVSVEEELAAAAELSGVLAVPTAEASPGPAAVAPAAPPRAVRRRPRRLRNPPCPIDGT